MLPNEYTLNKNGKNIEEVVGISKNEIQTSLLKSILNNEEVSVNAYTGLILVAWDMPEWSMLGHTLNALTGLNLETPLDIVEYMLKSLSKEDYKDWVFKMVVSKERPNHN